MIARISGKLIETKEQSVIIDVNGLFYEVMTPASVIQRINDTKDEQGKINLVTYHYFQIGPANGTPVLIGFINEIERDFFMQFISVSGIGPKAAIRALDRPISEIAYFIDKGDINSLKKLPGIGNQKAKDIVAKLQGKISKFGLIQDKGLKREEFSRTPGWQEEVLTVLTQLQYKSQEASEMIKKALERNPDINTTEELLNEIYKQRVKN